MKLPNFAQPVSRTISNVSVKGGVQTSGIACTACCAAANLLPWPASTAAKLACKAAISGCSC